MTDKEFAERLLKELIEHARYAFPWPPLTSHDRVQYLAYAARFLCPEYVFKWPQMDWFENPAIQRFYQSFPGERELFNMDRRWNVLQLLRLVAAVPGDTVECGVFEGATSLLILEHVPPGPTGRRLHHMFDSFAGLSEPGEHDHERHFRKGDLACTEERVRRVLAAHATRTCYYKGWIPERFGEVAESSFAFVHIDVDLYLPTKASIEFFYPRLNPGGVLICDDYGFNTCPGATKAVEDFLADKPEKMLAFASGGGFLIKGVPTADGVN